MPALRKRFGNLHSAKYLISVISEDFPVGTQQAELDVKAIVTNFRNCFGGVNYSSPLAFSNPNGQCDWYNSLHALTTSKRVFPWNKIWAAPFSSWCIILSVPALRYALLDSSTAVLSSEKKDTGGNLTFDTFVSSHTVVTVLCGYKSSVKFIFIPGVEVTEDAKNSLPTVINLSGDSTAGTDKSGNTPTSANGTAGISGGVDGVKLELSMYLEPQDLFQIVILGLPRLNKNYSQRLQSSWLTGVHMVVDPSDPIMEI